jgi:hypothetical protein
VQAVVYAYEYGLVKAGQHPLPAPRP